MTFPNGDIYACKNWEAGKLNERCLKYCEEDKTWKIMRYLLTVQLDGPFDENLHQEFLEIKDEILKKSAVSFEYKVNFIIIRK